MNDDPDDPFEGIETVQNLPADPSPEFLAETTEEPKKQPANDSLFRGLKRQSVLAFVQYFKDNCPGKVNADLTITFVNITDVTLDKMAECFIEGVPMSSASYGEPSTESKV